MVVDGLSFSRLIWTKFLFIRLRFWPRRLVISRLQLCLASLWSRPSIMCGIVLQSIRRGWWNAFLNTLRWRTIKGRKWTEYYVVDCSISAILENSNYWFCKGLPWAESSNHGDEWVLICFPCLFSKKPPEKTSFVWCCVCSVIVLFLWSWSSEVTSFWGFSIFFFFSFRSTVWE